MSVASPAQSQVRRTVAAAPSRSSQPIRQAQAPQAFAFPPDREDEFRLNISDMPVTQETLDVEAFNPSVLSRLLDMFAPLKKR